MRKFLWLLVLMFFVQSLFANESVPAAISKVESWIKERYKDSPRARKYVEQQLDVIIDSLERDEVKIRKMREKFPQAFLSAEELFEIAEKYFKADNNKEAVKWYRMAAEKGHAESQYAYALSLLDRNGIKKNKKEVEVWLKKAADQGHAYAREVLYLLKDFPKLFIDCQNISEFRKIQYMGSKEKAVPADHLKNFHFNRRAPAKK